MTFAKQGQSNPELPDDYNILERIGDVRQHAGSEHNPEASTDQNGAPDPVSDQKGVRQKGAPTAPGHVNSEFCCGES